MGHAVGTEKWLSSSSRQLRAAEVMKAVEALEEHGARIEAVVEDHLEARKVATQERDDRLRSITGKGWEQADPGRHRTQQGELGLSVARRLSDRARLEHAKWQLSGYLHPLIWGLIIGGLGVAVLTDGLAWMTPNAAPRVVTWMILGIVAWMIDHFLLSPYADRVRARRYWRFLWFSLDAATTRLIILQVLRKTLPQEPDYDGEWSLYTLSSVVDGRESVGSSYLRMGTILEHLRPRERERLRTITE